MKTLLVALALAALVRACGGEPDPVAPVAAAPPAPAAAFAVNAIHGGSVILVEDQYVEVVPKSDGVIEAYVLTPPPAPGAVVVAQPAPSNVSVKIQGDDGAEHDVALTWSPATARFEGRLVEARPAPGPIEVTVIAPGRPPRRARAPQVIVVAAPPPAVVVEHRAPVVVAPAPPVVVVEPPRPAVVVVEPPRPGVVVVAPQAPGVVVVDDHPGRGRGHAYGRRRGGTVVIGAPAPPAVIVAPGHPRAVVVGPGHGSVVVAPGRGHGGHGHGHGGGRGHGRH